MGVRSCYYFYTRSWGGREGSGLRVEPTPRLRIKISRLKVNGSNTVETLFSRQESWSLEEREGGNNVDAFALKVNRKTCAHAVGIKEGDVSGRSTCEVHSDSRTCRRIKVAISQNWIPPPVSLLTTSGLDNHQR